MIITINQDIFEAPIDVLVHQANCFHTFGAGIAKAIKEKFPDAYNADLVTGYGYPSKLGTYSMTSVKDKNIKYVVNLYGQFHYGREKRHTDYEAVRNGLSLIESLFEKETIGIPYKMGCGLGGGEWSIIETIIQEVFVDYQSDVLICKI